jgi:CPA1 family monovalent cation:H+ antiporter
MLDLFSACIVITALLAYLNHRFVGLPTTIGVMAAALVFTLAIVMLNALGFAHGLHDYQKSFLHSIRFSDVVLQGMLSLLLFASALHVELTDLHTYRWPITILASVGTLLSTLAVGYGMWFTLPMTGLELPLIYCLIFGALISPTDPIAVMSILKSAGAPKELNLVISGESLFNDGIAVVLFALLLGMLHSGIAPTAEQGMLMLLREAGGGLIYGIALGYATFYLLRSVDNYQVEVLLTLATVSGGYALAYKLHVSGPLAMVAAGLIIGNQGRALAMSDTTRRYVDTFWELIDEILNAMLFTLIGMEVLFLVYTVGQFAFAAAVAIAVTLAARLVTIGVPVGLLQRFFRLPNGSWKVLTWGGLRGGISVALALSLPSGPERDTVVAVTYWVVVFSILVQGLTLGRVTRNAVASA